MHSKTKTGILLVNLGTPDSPSTADVRKYLREFLLDPRVIDINPIGRFLLVNLIIAPFRSPKSAKLYKEIWSEKGSPLLFYGIEVKNLLQKELGDDFVVELGMRYQSPSLEEAVQKFKSHSFDKVIILPLFPQYASASTGSVYEKIMKITSKWEFFPSIEFISDFHQNEQFLDAFANLGKKYLKAEEYDHILFSFHGLPERQIQKTDCSNLCLVSKDCCESYNEKNRFCYKASSFETARQIAKRLNLKADDYTISFQSRLGREEWIKPYTTDTLKDFATRGIKKVLVFCPAFICDCLETVYEVSVELNEEFRQNGGDKVQLVEGLNSNPDWIKAIRSILQV
ncbi:MAG: ferrochelatase [Calditrichaeota bacterium]|nr:MAG: ferrochelatase [Calditrichota bacterium]